MKKDQITLVAAPLRKQVIERLRNAIVTFEFQPGERLVERDLCERYDVSRTVIREALRHLEAEGLVDIVANHGPIVSTTSPGAAKSLYEVREALEGLAARLCAERAQPAQKKKLARAVTQIGGAYAKSDLAAQLAAKDDFYRQLCEGADNEVIASTLRSIQARVQVLRGLSLQEPGRADQSLAELEAVVAAIDRGDAKAAEKLAVQHVRNAAATALRRLAEQERETAAAS